MLCRRSAADSASSGTAANSRQHDEPIGIIRHPSVIEPLGSSPIAQQCRWRRVETGSSPARTIVVKTDRREAPGEPFCTAQPNCPPQQRRQRSAVLPLMQHPTGSLCLACRHSLMEDGHFPCVGTSTDRKYIVREVSVKRQLNVAHGSEAVAPSRARARMSSPISPASA